MELNNVDILKGKFEKRSYVMEKKCDKKKKTIIQFVPELNEGGAEKLVCDYCKYLKQDGYEVILFEIFPPYESITYKKILEMGTPLYYVYPQKNKFWLFVNRRFAKFYIPYKLRKMIKKTNADVIHLHLSWLRFFTEISSFLAKKNIKLLYTCHNTPPVYFSGRKEAEFYAAKRLIESNNLQIIALSHQMQAELNFMFEVTNVALIHNAIEKNNYGSGARPGNDVRKKLGISQDAFVVGHIGRFAEQKNHKFLINVFSEVLKKKKQAILLLVGSGELKDEINTMISRLGIDQKVVVLSSRNDIPDLLNAMDVFVFPSFYEGLGIALIEAQFANLKCVTSDCVPNDVYITNNVTTLSLNDSISVWVDAITKDIKKSKICSKQSDYDIALEIKKLEMLYFE